MSDDLFAQKWAGIIAATLVVLAGIFKGTLFLRRDLREDRGDSKRQNAWQDIVDNLQRDVDSLRKEVTAMRDLLISVTQQRDALQADNARLTLRVETLEKQNAHQEQEIQRLRMAIGGRADD